MSWYKSAATIIVFKYIGDELLDDYGDSITLTIPRFTMVCDSNHESVYTLVDEVTLKTDGTLSYGAALEGTAEKFTVDGETKITAVNLDSRNRLYFPIFNIAENGVFINNVDSQNFASWVRKDNLLVEEVALNNKFYKFGVSQDLNSCYVEFPENVEEIFQDGINITYIKTLGADGNISTGFLDSFYEDAVAYHDEEVLSIDTSTVAISNYIPGLYGENPESIEDAYLNYKKTVGTFDTLVTLRDYMNAVCKSTLVSNAVVSDRTTDQQTTYRVMSETGSLDQPINYVELTDKYTVKGYYYGVNFWKDEAHTQIIDPDINLNYIDITPTPGTNIPKNNTYRVFYMGGDPVYHLCDPAEIAAMNAFDLKMYLFGTTPLMKTPEHFNQTFTLTNDEITTATVASEIADYKCAQHNFIELLPNKICFIKNKYPLDIKVIPQYPLTNEQRYEVAENIRQMLYQSLNSAKLEFGEELSYDNLYQIIVNADPRIKNIYLASLEYTPYAVYLDEKGEIKEVNISEYVTYFCKTYLFKNTLSPINLGIFNMPVQTLLEDGTITGGATKIQIYVDNSDNFSVKLLNYQVVDSDTVTDLVIYTNGE